MTLSLLPLSPADREWRSRANCLDVDPDSMHPDEATDEDVEVAKRVCRGCPVFLDCRTAALSHAAYGVWAGEWHGEPPRLPERECDWCGELFQVQRSTARFCSGAHQKAARRAEQRTAV
jgi:hypothetical protein